MEATRISLSGLDVEWQRMQVIAQNLANMNSTRTGAGEPVRAMRLVSGPDQNFAAMLETGASGVRVLGVEAQGDGLRQLYEPDHPHANADGFVTYPDIDHAAEMALMIKTSRVYEANLAAFSAAQDMYLRALDIGRQA
jgi:flagellar basal-body rod protein FlgC